MPFAKQTILFSPVRLSPSSISHLLTYLGTPQFPTSHGKKNCSQYPSSPLWSPHSPLPPPAASWMQPQDHGGSTSLCQAPQPPCWSHSKCWVKKKKSTFLGLPIDLGSRLSFYKTKKKKKMEAQRCYWLIPGGPKLAHSRHPPDHAWGPSLLGPEGGGEGVWSNKKSF